MYSIHIHMKVINLGFQESHLSFWAFFTKSSSILERGELDIWTSKSLQSFLPWSPSSSTPSLIIVFLAILAMLIYLKLEWPLSELLHLHHLQNLCLVLPSLLPHFQFLFHKTSIYLKNFKKWGGQTETMLARCVGNVCPKTNSWESFDKTIDHPCCCHHQQPVE